MDILAACYVRQRLEQRCPAQHGRRRILGTIWWSGRWSGRLRGCGVAASMPWDVSLGEFCQNHRPKLRLGLGEGDAAQGGADMVEHWSRGCSQRPWPLDRHSELTPPRPPTPLSPPPRLHPAYLPMSVQHHRAVAAAARSEVIIWTHKAGPPTACFLCARVARFPDRGARGTIARVPVHRSTFRGI